uniref:Uncharacterized protein n=1 Tax=Anguilla anguilla TaxID=7936 RepID=A0A0E9UFP7_ANGAN
MLLMKHICSNRPHHPSIAVLHVSL